MVIVQPGGSGGDGGGSGYVLPPATQDTLGGIKVGQNLTIEADGTLNATGGGDAELNVSTSGLYINAEDDPVKIGYQSLTPSAGEARKIVGAIQYKKGSSSYNSDTVSVPSASKDGWGVMRVGDGLSVADGVVSVDATDGGWEVLNLSSLPTDFADGDVLKMIIAAVPTADTTSWNIAPTNPGIGDIPDNNTGEVIEIRLTSGYYPRNRSAIISVGSGVYRLCILLLDDVENISSWNNPSTSTRLFKFRTIAFNAAGRESSATAINRSNIATYVSKMWRKKKELPWT